MSEIKVDTITPSLTVSQVTITPGIVVTDSTRVNVFEVTNTGLTKFKAPLYVGSSASSSPGSFDDTVREVLSSHGSGSSPSWEPTIPIGTVIMWFGSVADIPRGWGLCNGSIQNGIQTPDLRNRFVVGSGGKYTTGNSGGANTFVIQDTNLPSEWRDHRQPYGCFSSYLSGSFPGITPYMAAALNKAGAVYRNFIDNYWFLNGGELQEDGCGGGEYQDSGSIFAYTSGPKTVVNAAAMTSVDVVPSGNPSDSPVDNIPTYYSLCYIIRIPI